MLMRKNLKNVLLWVSHKPNNNCQQRNLTDRTIDTYKQHLIKLERYLMGIGHSTIISDIDKETLDNYC